MSELRYHPFLDQWVITATHRQDRTFHPPAGYCPLCPTAPGGFPTEIPRERYDIAVFQNKFPSLSPHPPEPEEPGSPLMPVRPSFGVCEVVCYTDRHDLSLAQLPLRQVRKLTRVWQERTRELSAVDGIEYVFIFENKGKEIGVTLSHPHGQIYAYPYIPPTIETMLRSEARHFENTGRPLTGDWLDEERADGRRLVWENDHFVAVVPFFARYPYEVHLCPVQHRGSLVELTTEELDALAEALLAVTGKYDRLFGFSMPYIMAIYQRPAVPGYDYTWLSVQFFPPYRTETKLKFLAGSESGAGAFINDTLPEETAPRLRAL